MSALDLYAPRVAHLMDWICWRLAWWLPRRVALYAFVRVYGAWGECGKDYQAVYDTWVAGGRRYGQ